MWQWVGLLFRCDPATRLMKCDYITVPRDVRLTGPCLGSVGVGARIGGDVASRGAHSWRVVPPHESYSGFVSVCDVCVSGRERGAELPCARVGSGQWDVLQAGYLVVPRWRCCHVWALVLGFCGLGTVKLRIGNCYCISQTCAVLLCSADCFACCRCSVCVVVLCCLSLV